MADWVRRSFSVVGLLVAVATTGWAQLQVSAPGAGYSAAVQGLAPAATPTDVFTIAGSASKVILPTKIVISCTQTTAGAIDVLFIKRSTADTLGTSTAPTAVRHDSNSAAATATLAAYTANPTLGTAVGNVGTYKLACLAPATATPQDALIERFGPPGAPLLVRGTAEQLVVNLNSVTVTGGSFNIRIEWVEQ
jgi:hypothetical protein